MTRAQMLPPSPEKPDPTVPPRAAPAWPADAIARAGIRHKADVRTLVYDLDRRWRSGDKARPDLAGIEESAPGPRPPVARAPAIVAHAPSPAAARPVTVTPALPRLGSLLVWAPRHALAYLAAITIAELVVALVSPTWGFFAHGAILTILLIHGASSAEPAERRLLLSLTIVPIIRISSLALPLAPFDRQWWYALVSVPLLAAAIVSIRLLALTPNQLALRLPSWRHWPATLLVALSGIPLGFLEYRLLRPSALAEMLTFASMVLPVIIFVIATGFTEELIFRGILQVTAIEAFGVPRGIVYVSLLFGALHIGHWSPVDVAFVTGVALYFAVVVRWTRTLLGVTLAHGVTNIMLFVVLPLILPRLPLA